jgi:cytochrome c oxidase subunit 3
MEQVQTNKVIAQATEGDKAISSVSMIVALVSFGMLFLTLMMSFALYRFTAPVWPPAGMAKPSLLIPTISTVMIVLSSYFYITFEKNTLSGVVDRKNLTLTLILGVGFMVSQFLFWEQLKSHGLYVSSGVFPSILYAFTWIHAAHLIGGLLLLVWLYSVLKNPTKKTSVKVMNVGKYWHFLGIVWLVMFVTIFVL